VTFHAAVFDLDGTLLDSYEGIHDALSDVLAHFGRPPVTVEETRRLVGHGLEALIAKVLPENLRADAVNHFRFRYKVNAPKLTKLMPGAELVVTELWRRGVRLSIASNKPAVFSRQLLAGFGLSELFTFIGGPDLGFPEKPDPAMVLGALLAMRALPVETLYVGDMTVDIATARAAGLSVAVIPEGSSTREELEALGPDYLLSALPDVLRFFGDVPLSRE
jgi:phosphoglycolate phosphatase